MDVLTPYDTRKEVFSWLSAFDIAKLDLLLEHILDETERRTYLNPVRDIVWNRSQMNSLAMQGMKLILCGDDDPLLHQRLHDTESYLRTYGCKRRLQIYLIGIFPFPQDVADVNDSMSSFSVRKDSCTGRIWKDRRELERMFRVIRVYSLPSKTSFLMSFGTPIAKPIQPAGSTWYAESDLPESTIDLKVYVPSYSARFHGEISLPYSVIPGLFGFASRKTCLLRLPIMYVRIITDRIQLPHISYLTTAGLKDPLRKMSGQEPQEELDQEEPQVESEQEQEEGAGQVNLRFHFKPSLLFRDLRLP
jgi:hypothetical protein